MRLYAISMQNEPDMSFTYWTPDEVVDFVKRYGPTIRRTGVKLLAPEACGSQPAYTEPVIADADILVTAYVNDSETETTLVALNLGSTAANAKIALGGSVISGETTTETQNMVSAAIATLGNTAYIHLPAHSIVSVRMGER